MSNKPEITATIKFRGVTIEGMTVEELKQLRDVLNTIVGEPQRVVERHDHIYLRPYPAYPYGYYSPIWAVSQTYTDGRTVSGNTLTLNGNPIGAGQVMDNAYATGFVEPMEPTHYSINLDDLATLRQ